ncbi:MAG: hypothetical protein QXW58_05110 [Thermosphaera sp.]
MNTNSFHLLGLLLKGSSDVLEKIVRDFENRKDVKLCYVKRAGKNEYIIPIKARRENQGGSMWNQEASLK